MNRTKYLTLMALTMTVTLSSAKTPSSYANQSKSWEKHQTMRENTPYAGILWRNVGPVVQGGRAVDVIRPTDQPHVIYVGYASGGVWKSENNGHNFRPLTDDLPSQIVGSLSIDPNDSDVLWLGTGENNSSRSSYGGMGVFKSTDGGENWQHMGLGDTDRIGRILIDPEDSNQVYVAALGKLYSKGGDRGLYRTQDGGQTWETLIEGKDWTGFIDVARSPNGTLYASAWDRSRSAWNFVESGTGSAVYRSVDGGDNWERLTQGLPTDQYVGRIGLAVSVSEPDTIYLSIDNQTPLPESEWDMGDTAVNVKRLNEMDKETFLIQDEKAIENFLRGHDFPPEMTADSVIQQVKNDELTPQELVEKLADGNTNLFNVDIRSLEIYRSDDNGNQFKRTHNDGIQGVVFSYGYYFGQIKVDPQDADTVYATGVPLIKSTDGGKTWHSAWHSSVHADFQALWIDPKHSNHIMVGNDGGVDESYDGGHSWKKIDAQPVGQFYTIAVDMAEPYNIYGGLQDNGTLKGSSTNLWHDDVYRGSDWTRIFGGDGMHVNIDDDEKLTYVGYQFGNAFRLGSAAPKKITPPNYVGEESLRKNWNTPVMMSAHNKDILYYAGHRVHRSMDQGETWTAISDDLTESENRGDVPFATATSLSESPLKFGLIWVGTDDGLVWVTENGGHNWKKVSQKLPKGHWVSRIIASPHEEKRAWLALNNYRNDDIEAYLYKTDNLGKNWERMNAGLPNEALNVVKEDPENAEVVYVGTDKGIYVSTDLGQHWDMLGNGVPTVPVHDLIVHPREHELVIGTHGRSVFVADVAPIQTLDQEIRGGDLHIYPVEELSEASHWDTKPFQWSHTDNLESSTPIYVWAKAAGEAQLSILMNEKPIFEKALTLQSGLNRWDWDHRIDVAKASDAETEGNAEKEESEEAKTAQSETQVETNGEAPESTASGDESNPADQVEMPTNLALTPYAESVRLGHPPYIEPGEYQLHIKQGESEQTIDFTVK